MSEILRQKILAEARSYIGTPFHHGAGVKGVGVDCGYLLLRVYADTGVIDDFPLPAVPPEWHLHRGDEHYLDALARRSTEMKAPKAGDVALFRVGRCYSHGGLISVADPLTIIHASAPAGVVLEETVDQNLDIASAKRDVRFFDLIGGCGA